MLYFLWLLYHTLTPCLCLNREDLHAVPGLLIQPACHNDVFGNPIGMTNWAANVAPSFPRHIGHFPPRVVSWTFVHKCPPTANDSRRRAPHSIASYEGPVAVHYYKATTGVLNRVVGVSAKSFKIDPVSCPLEAISIGRGIPKLIRVIIYRSISVRGSRLFKGVCRRDITMARACATATWWRSSDAAGTKVWNSVWWI